MQAIRNKALALLARREHSCLELAHKLERRGFSAEAIALVLEELVQENVLSEARFIESFIYTRQARGMGPLKICAQLKARGIKQAAILNSEIWQSTCWQQHAVKVRIKRFGRALPQQVSQRLQQSRFLQQRGFTLEQICASLKSS